MADIAPDLSAVLSRPDGVRLIRYILAEARALDPIGPGADGYQAGQRDVGLRLLALVRIAAPERLAALLLPEEVP